MSKLRYALLSTLPLAAAGYLWFGHAGSAASAPADVARARPVALVAPGRVEPLRDPVKLGFEIAGRIVAIEVEEGDRVTANQVIARLDDRLARARVAAAQAAVAQARAHLALAKRGPRAEDLSAARADAEAAAAAAKHRAIEQVRSDELGKRGAVTSSAVDADDAAARVASAQATAAAARYASLAKGTRGEQIDEAVAQLAAAQADLDAATVGLDQTVLRAPGDGVIVRRTAEVGALVQTMTPAPIVTFADLRQLEVRAEIDEADVAAIAQGQVAYATADAFGEQRFPVHVTRIARELGRRSVRDDDPRARVDTRVLEVIAQFDGAPTLELPLGLRVDVHLATTKR